MYRISTTAAAATPRISDFIKKRLAKSNYILVKTESRVRRVMKRVNSEMDGHSTSCLFYWASSIYLFLGKAMPESINFDTFSDSSLFHHLSKLYDERINRVSFVTMKFDPNPLYSSVRQIQICQLRQITHATDTTCSNIFHILWGESCFNRVFHEICSFS